MNWYFAVDGRSHGPVSEQELSELAFNGGIGKDTLIWHPGLTEWEPVWKLKPGLTENFNKVAMAQQARGTTDRIPVAGMNGAAESTSAGGGILGKVFRRLRKK